MRRAIGPGFADIEVAVAIGVAGYSRQRRRIRIAQNIIGQRDVAGVGDGDAVVDNAVCGIDLPVQIAVAGN